MSDARPLVFVLLEDERDLPLLPLAAPLGDVLALSCAPSTENERLDTLLRRARARGAARAARNTDPVIGGVDYLAIAHVLACAVRHLCEPRPDAPVLVVAGDRGRGAVGPAVAERLAVPHLGAVRAVQLDGARVLVDRLCGAELRRWAGSAPIVVAWTAAAATTEEPPPDPALAVEQLALEALQITVPELQYRRRFRPEGGAAPPTRPHLVSNVELLGDRLARDGLWPLPSEDAEAPKEP